MIDFGSASAQICVVGPSAFASVRGALAFGTAELLARNFPVSFLPTEPEARRLDAVTLPNGRALPIYRDGAAVAVCVFCDDFGHWPLVPLGSCTYAWLLFDSDVLPARSVALLNARADAVLVPSPRLIDIARRTGIERPITHLPFPRDLDETLARPFAPQRPRLTFGSIGPIPPRYGVDTLADAFRRRFAGDDRAALVLHDPLSQGELTAQTRAELIDSIDVFVSCAPVHSGCLPEALAAGKAIVAPAMGDSLDLAELPGVFLVPAQQLLPARHPEIDNDIFDEQHAVTVDALAEVLGAARDFVHSDAFRRTAQDRRNRASQSSFSRVASSVGALIDASIGRYRPATFPPTAEVAVAVETRLGRRADAIGGIRRQVCAAHDGGFFSVFNTFISHLVWQEREDRCHAVLPDWDAGRFIARAEAPIQSFCYGQPGDGNLWLKLFQPLFGATPAEMNDESWLWRHAELPLDRHNQDREPTLTYVRAYQLYNSPQFEGIRRQYHRVFTRHVHLLPEHASEVEAFAAEHLQAPVLIAAHVRHPSHTVEQPGGRIARTEAYIERVRAEVRRRGADPDGPGWTVFVATDQERVLRRFAEVFGARAVFYPDARRTRADEDAAFDALTQAEQNSDGHQLQHLVAADQRNWTWRMAWEVVRDAYTMARCDCLLHVVSNVSTAVAYMNPRIEMIFCQP